MVGVGVGTIPSPLHLTKATIPFPIFYFRPQLQHHYTPLSLLRQNGFCLFAQKKHQNSGISKIELEREDFDDGFGVDDNGDDFDEDFLDDIDDEGDDDDDDDVMVPLDQMDAWLEKKPKGFGEGKVYDTSVEDTLLVELEKIREAQVANIAKLKNQSKLADPSKELQKEVKVSEIAPGCIRVRINNLPKKKNIQRDLKSAFQGVRGIANIFPMVSGTKKTRDPVCKGFAFVDFKSLEDANRFTQLFSGQNISFGKMEKRIKCDILKLGDDGNVGSVREAHNIVSKARISVLEEEINEVDDVGELKEEVDIDEFDEESDDEDIMGKFELLNSSETSDIGSVESRLPMQSSVSSSAKRKEKKMVKKPPAVKKKPDKSTKAKASVYDSISKAKITSLGKDAYQVRDIEEASQLDSLEDDDFDDLDEEDDDDEDFVVNLDLLKTMKRGDIESIESRLLKQSFDPLPTKQKEKKKPDNVTKVNVPGSMHEKNNTFKAKITPLQKEADKVYDHHSDYSKDDDFDELYQDEEGVDIVENVELLKSVKQTFSPSSTKVKEKRVNKKKPAVKKTSDNATKIKLPGSSKRLKVQEKAKLADVFSKYAAREKAMTSKET